MHRKLLTANLSFILSMSLGICWFASLIWSKYVVCLIFISLPWCLDMRIYDIHYNNYDNYSQLILSYMFNLVYNCNQYRSLLISYCYIYINKLKLPFWYRYSTSRPIHFYFSYWPTLMKPILVSRNLSIFSIHINDTIEMFCHCCRNEKET